MLSRDFDYIYKSICFFFGLTHAVPKTACNVKKNLSKSDRVTQSDDNNCNNNARKDKTNCTKVTTANETKFDKRSVVHVFRTRIPRGSDGRRLRRFVSLNRFGIVQGPGACVYSRMCIPTYKAHRINEIYFICFVQSSRRRNGETR